MTLSLSILFTEKPSKNDKFSTTYITISPKKDGLTAKTKCINPQTPSFLPLKRKLKVSSNFTSIFPKLRMLNSPLRDRSNTLWIDVPLLTLPNELISYIVFFLDYSAIQRLSQTCRRIRSICHDDADLWRRLLQTDFRTAHPFPRHHYRNRLTLERRWQTGKVTTRFLQGHEDSVYCSAWIGKHLLVTGSRDQAIKIWDVRTGECQQTIKQHDGSVLCMRVFDRWLMTGSSDATCILWSLPTIEPRLRLRGHGHSILDVCWVSGKIVTSSKDHTLRVWDGQTGDELRQLLGHTASVNALDTVHHNQVVSASGDTTVKWWDVESGNCLKTFVGHELGLACVRFDGTFLYSGGLDGKIIVWDIETGSRLHSLTGHGKMIRSIDCLEGKLVSGSYDRTLKVWDPKTGDCILSFQSAQSSSIYNVLLSNTHIVSSGQDKQIMVLDFVTGLDI
ncbi:hypothetical protein G6F56_002298 [Rhizopus delemar]|uniref:F-box domain-containing protein n=1 Tax=Rhizopus stolonifer TaxID=4846 RepID=A0A367KJ30_RHIST|nr:hypothetical protein G6F56_002298 [Rhizopus delemar]RCI02150.1 hypothetical protein CU098_007850 [Rhizopus stolonifer]